MSALHDAEGTVTGSVESSYDVTECQEAFRALREMRAAIDMMNDAVIVTDAGGVITGWNHQAEALYGYSSEEILGRAANVLAAEGAFSPFPELTNVLVEGGRVEPYVAQRRRKDGSTFSAGVSISAVVDDTGALSGVVALTRDVTAEQDAKTALEASERLHRSLVARSADAAIIVDADGILTYVSDSAQALSGIAPSAMVGTNAFDYIHPDDHEYMAAEMAHTLEQGHGFISEQVSRFRFLCGDGTYRRAELVVTNLIDDDVVAGLVCNVRDVTETDAADEALIASEARYRSLAAHAADTAVIINPDGNFQWVSPSVRNLLGYDPEDLCGRSYRSILPEGYVTDAADMVFNQLVAGPAGAHLVTEATLIHADGHHVCVELTSSNLLEDRHVGGIVVNLRDISERKQSEQELRRLALHDHLTGLPNRVQILNRIETTLASSAHDAAHLAVMLCDLDDFKLVNDSLGHVFGDRLLCELAERLVRSVRSGDMVARLGGDEFVILCEHIDPDGAREVAQRVLDALSEPVRLADAELVLTSSIGVAFGPTSDGTTLLSNADAAMYEAKAAGKNRVGIYDATLRATIAETLALTNDLHRAVRHGDLELHYQPIVDLASGETVGAEGLLRWTHPQRGPIAPDQFIPLAEAGGLINTIGRDVLRQACYDFGPHGPLGGRDLSVSVNVSPHQLDNEGFLSVLDEALAHGDMDPSHLRLEVTESAIMGDPELSLKILTAVRDRGVGLAIDDFGTGYSSLAYLKRFPFETVKVDRAFISGVGDNVDDTVIVEAIVKVASTLRMSVTAEGIEDAAMVPRLQTLGCTTGQGWLWARALPAQELRRWLTERDA